MEKSQFSHLRVLLVGGKTHSAQTLRSVLTLAGVVHITQVEASARAIELLSMEIFDVVFCDDATAPYQRRSFPTAVRRTESVLSPLLPVFVFREQAYRRTVEQARDTGATDFITCPVSPRTVMDKLQAAIANPRPFIKAPDFFGPDRRARARAPFHGEDRRVRQPKKIKIAKGGRDILPDEPVLV